jgi:hypothetical protein
MQSTTRFKYTLDVIMPEIILRIIQDKLSVTRDEVAIINYHVYPYQHNNRQWLLCTKPQESQFLNLKNLV